ncbi:MAG: putative signal transducing protein [Bacillota bacterium]
MDQNHETNWVEATAVYNQDEAQLITGLLTMAGIPVRVERESAGDIYGLTIGPLAKVSLLVPADRLEDAGKILAGEAEDFLTDEEES